MTLQECTALLAPLGVALGVAIDDPTYRAYHRCLQDVPLPLLQRACDVAITRPRGHYEARFPTPMMLRQWAEEARQVWLKQFPWSACEVCAENSGFVEVLDEHGVTRLTRCSCWREHQTRLAQSGMATVLALPPAESDSAEADL